MLTQYFFLEYFPLKNLPHNININPLSIKSATLSMSLVSSYDIQKARRVALRIRSPLACIPCKIAKRRCRDYRPCSRCLELSPRVHCKDSVCWLCWFLENDFLKYGVLQQDASGSMPLPQQTSTLPIHPPENLEFTNNFYNKHLWMSCRDQLARFSWEIG